MQLSDSENEPLTSEGLKLRKEIIESALNGEYSLAHNGLNNRDPRVRSTSVSVLAENGILDEYLDRSEEHTSELQSLRHLV